MARRLAGPGSTMSAFDIIAAFLLLVAIIGWVNTRYLHLPTGVAMVLAGAAGSAALMALQAGGVLPPLAAQALRTLRGLDFPQAVLGDMLAFLLFAGAMQVDLSELRRRRLSVWSLATVGVVVSTGLVGGGLWLVAGRLGLDFPLPWAIVFGALISPTDPIAVFAALKQGRLSGLMQAVLQGEALFNDGVGIVVFSAALAVAGGRGAVDPAAAILRVALEAGGGLAFGVLAGVLAVRAMRAIDDYAVEVSVSLAVAMGAYAGARALGLSGPIAVVAAGLLVGDGGVATAMSRETRRYVQGFWTLVDEILNALLFLLLGLELAVIGLDWRDAGFWLAAIALVLAARWIVVAPWGATFRLRRGERGATAILTWGGLHGALSLALALSVPAAGPRSLLLSTTFAVVLFSVVVQGLTFPAVVARVSRAPETPVDPDQGD